MKPPIRMVCGDCLQSVEIAVDEAGMLPTLATCPFCGGTIDSRLSEMGTESSDPTDPLFHGVSTPDDGSKYWSETWVKGSLGTLGRFQLREVLGDGGSGQVYQAYDPRLDRDIALKVLKLNDPGERVKQRFFREARAAARLDHPNIVCVFDAGCDDNRCWIAYRYVSGRTLLRHRDQQRLDRAASVRIIRDLADALDHAHRHGIYHRDLKPSNILIDERGRAHLTDFGLARRADLDSGLTRHGAIIGTPMYMSPEQANGQSHLADERSDVYSLGVIFYELLTGQKPTNLPSRAPFWMSPPTEPPKAPRTLDRTIPAALERICMKAVAVEPDQRYPDARAFRDELDQWLGRHQGTTRLSHPLVCVILGIGAALLLIVGLKAVLSPTTFERAQPAAFQAEPAGSTGIAVVAEPIKPYLVGNMRSDSKVYHWSTCSRVRNGIAHPIHFNDADEADAKNYRPCQYCNPHHGDTPPLPKSTSGN